METKMSMTMKSSQGMNTQFVSLDPNAVQPKLEESGFIESNPQEEKEESYDFSSCDFEKNAGEQVVDDKSVAGTGMAESQAKLVRESQNKPMMSRTGFLGKSSDKHGLRDMIPTVKKTGKVRIGEDVLPKAKLGHKDQE
jgi:hypothetical protein